MDKFTKLNLNGVDKFVSAIYDGSGNEIVSTYETKTDATSKETILSNSITTVSEALESLKDRVIVTEKFASEIENNKLSTQLNTESIATLKEADKTIQESLNNLIIKVNENSSEIVDLKENTGTLSSSFLQLNTELGLLKAIINNEDSGINALNTLVDKNTASIADLLIRIVKLEEALITPEV